MATMSPESLRDDGLAIILMIAVVVILGIISYFAGWFNAAPPIITGETVLPNGTSTDFNTSSTPIEP